MGRIFGPFICWRILHENQTAIFSLVTLDKVTLYLFLRLKVPLLQCLDLEDLIESALQ